MANDEIFSSSSSFSN